MKKSIKFIVTALFAATVFAAVPNNDVISVNASAAEKLTTSVDYDYYGTAFLTMIPADESNVIYYTTDGSAPNTESKVYDGEIAVYEQTVVRMAEYTVDGERVSGIKKTVKPKLAPVTFKVEQDENAAKAYITLDCITPNAEIYYTTDGSVPDEDATLYTEAITITSRTKIRAKAYCDGYVASNKYSKTVNVDYVNESKLDTVKYKTAYFGEEGYTYIALQKSKNGNTIRYTTDGSVPNKNSKKYSKRVKFTEPGVIRAREYNSKGECVATLKYNVKIKCAPVTFSCIGIAPGTRTIRLETETEGASIYYTLDGTTPEPDTAYLYTAPVVAGELADIKAAAFKDDHVRSVISWEIAMAIPFENSSFDFNNPTYSIVAGYINKYRVENGSTALQLDEKLTEAANLRAIEISMYFGSYRPNGLNYTSVYSEFGMTPEMSMEHISAYCENEEEFVNELLSNSAVARSILGAGYKHNKIGVGYFDSGKAKYWVLHIIEE